MVRALLMLTQVEQYLVVESILSYRDGIIDVYVIADGKSGRK